MARNVIKSDFRLSKIAATDHFVKKRPLKAILWLLNSTVNQFRNQSSLIDTNNEPRSNLVWPHFPPC